MSLYRCDACGLHLPYGSVKVKIGVREFCGPEASPCHTLGQRNAAWVFTPQEAAALLAADALTR